MLDRSYSRFHRTVLLCWNLSSFFNPIYVLNFTSAAVLHKNVWPKCCLAERYLLSLGGYSLSFQTIPRGIYTKVLLVITWLRCTMSLFLMESIIYSNEWRKISEFIFFWRAGSKLKADSLTNSLHNLKQHNISPFTDLLWYLVLYFKIYWIFWDILKNMNNWYLKLLPFLRKSGF